MKTKFVIPKGHLGKGSQEILENAGYKVTGMERTYRPTINDRKIDLKILRPQEIPILVAEGVHDIGITGMDWVKETGVDVEVLLDLEFGWIRMVLAVPKDWEEVNSLSDLLRKFWSEGKTVRISTEYLNTAIKYIKINQTYEKKFGDIAPLVITPWWKIGENKWVNIFLSFGATEAKPPENADAIIEVVETGATLDQNNLKIIETISESTAILIANKQSLLNPEKREKIYDILTLLKGVVDGRKKLHIFVNVKEENLNILVKELPALKRPTISPLSEKGWYSINTVIDQKSFLEILPILRKLAQGLVVHVPRQILSLEEIFEGEKQTSNI
ncbi:MAG: ATP phosphoribosyltransferase [Candidatus Bathyarchaeota archaeon]|nr:MAG: ATP phosphoribosyltransferase [Candidatus Bathyarchaeota archaeon]